jgi:hypothetical protein
LNKDLNLAFGYAQNTKNNGDSDNENKTIKAQLAYKAAVNPGDTDLILQYWKVDKNMLWPV